MNIICGLILFCAVLSFCGAQNDVFVAGFNCRPFSVFHYGSYQCICKYFGTSAHCEQGQFLSPTPVIERNGVVVPRKKSRKVELCTPGQKIVKGCNECICTASTLWACTQMDCENTKGDVKSSKKYSYDCFMVFQQVFKICRTVPTRCGTYMLNIALAEFFSPMYIELDAYCMEPKCTIGTAVQHIKYKCPEVEDTLDIDNTAAEEEPEVTTISQQPIQTTQQNHLTSTSTASEPENNDASVEEVTRPESIDPQTEPTTEGIDTSVEMVTTPKIVLPETVRPEKTSEFPNEATEDDSLEEKGPKETIASSGDVFSVDQFDDENFKCQASKSFKLECNTCWCRSDGKGARYCTRIACKPKTYKPLNQQ